MALIACPECDDRLSTHAERCPHCGYPYAKKRAMKASFLLVFGLVAALVAGGSAIHSALAARRASKHRVFPHSPPVALPRK